MPLPNHCLDCDKPTAGGALICDACVEPTTADKYNEEYMFTIVDQKEIETTDKVVLRVMDAFDTAPSDAEVLYLMEKNYPETTNEFKKIQKEQYLLFCRKQHDYGPQNISVGSQLKTKSEIKLSLTGLWFRMNDKIQRAKTLLINNHRAAVIDEPLDDAFLDVSNYGIMATIVKRKKWGK